MYSEKCDVFNLNTKKVGHFQAHNIYLLCHYHLYTPLGTTYYYTLPYHSATVKVNSCASLFGVWISICFITLCFQLFSTHYTAVQYESRTKHLYNQSCHYNKYRWFLLCKGSHHVVPLNWHFSLSAKMNGTQWRMLWKNALRVLWCAKRHFLGWSDIKQQKNPKSCYRILI